LYTGLIAEARLCGAVPVLLETPGHTFADARIYYKNTGASTMGIAWGDIPEEKARAKEELKEFRKDYYSLYASEPMMLRRFIDVTQNL
jgi:hypothetical protein